jgi:hypothetical protein
MNPGGDAAEQVVRLSLEGVEVAARITGNGAKNIALLLYATLKQEQKTKGKARLTNMLKSGKELKVYTITQKDLAKFAKEAKRYGVLYCVLKDRKNNDPNAAVDIIARAEDASKIQRIIERFRLSAVDRAEVSLDIQKDKEEMFPKEKSVREELEGGQPEPERSLPPIDDAERSAGRRIMGEPKKEEQEGNPSLAKTDRDHLSAPSSTQADRSSGYRGKTERPSVREKLEVYKAEIELTKREKAKELVSKGIEAAKDAVKAVPIPKVPGKER